MKLKKQKTFEDWMNEGAWLGSGHGKRKDGMSIPRYNFAKEVWAAAGGKFKSDEVSDEV